MPFMELLTLPLTILLVRRPGSLRIGHGYNSGLNQRVEMVFLEITPVGHAKGFQNLG